ncbi:MAG TPA: pyridoxamine 5'-phosphate oxidase family protein [Candidatus Saccharimonadales bacterium]|nr:pyridoxamine 5'-phosphate oxidase family protein [Candidatus Saccharimonadales bacterium]
MLSRLIHKDTATDTLGHRQRRIYNFLKENHTAVLSSVTPDGNPHGAVVYYMVDADFTFHILTKKGTRKYDNLAHNGHVMLTIFKPETQTTAQVTGIALERGGNANINEVAGGVFGASLQTSTSGLPPIVKLHAGPFTTFRIVPKQIRMAIYARPDSGNYNELFDSIESFELEADP